MGGLLSGPQAASQRCSWLLPGNGVAAERRCYTAAHVQIAEEFNVAVLITNQVISVRAAGRFCGH